MMPRSTASPDEPREVLARQRAWLQATCDFTSALVASTRDESEGEALDLFAARAREASGALNAAIFLPSLGKQWICEVADGPDAEALIGTAFSLSAPLLDLLAEGDLVTTETGLYLPIQGAGSLQGALFLAYGSSGMPLDERPMALAFAQQGALALDVVGSRQVKELALLLEERERISRDLHDLGIQDLFATGMMLQALRRDVDEGVSRRLIRDGLDAAMERLDDAVRQIRTIVYRLRDTDEPLGLLDALEHEASLARTHLGFAPTLTIELDGRSVSAEPCQDSWFREEIPARVSDSLAGDVVAVVREALTNVARHARAHSAQVRVSIFGTGMAGEIEVVIVDDGAGVDPSRTRNSGLSNMQRRAALHNGTFAVSAGPRGRGTSLVWRTPLG